MAKYKANGPWLIKNSKKIYQNAWMKVREDKVIRPDGKDGIVGIVEMMNGVTVLPLDDEGYVYLVQQYRYTIKKESIEAVSGGVAKGEKPLAAAKRELREEAGLSAQEWTALGQIDPFTTAIRSTSTLFLARKLKKVAAEPDSTEKIIIRRVKLAEALDMVIEGRIIQGPSCVVIMKAVEYLK